jgi:hypothetical protein
MYHETDDVRTALDGKSAIFFKFEEIHFGIRMQL